MPFFAADLESEILCTCHDWCQHSVKFCVECTMYSNCIQFLNQPDCNHVARVLTWVRHMRMNMA